MVGEDGYGVGKKHLLGKAHAEQARPGGEIAKALTAMEYLVLDGGITNDGAGYELGKHRCVHAQVERIALRGNLIAETSTT